MKLKEINWKVLSVSLFVVFLAAFIGSSFTSSQVDSEWYQSIKPDITPPNYVFPIVWNILFLMIAFSLYLSWINAEKKQREKVMLVYGLNLFINIAWSFFYFGFMNPLAAFFSLIALFLSIILVFLTAFKIRKKAAYLLLPYLLWVIFAGVLNYLSI
jgi:translocator protein